MLFASLAPGLSLHGAAVETPAAENDARNPIMVRSHSSRTAQAMDIRFECGADFESDGETATHSVSGRLKGVWDGAVGSGPRWVQGDVGYWPSGAPKTTGLDERLRQNGRMAAKAVAYELNGNVSWENRQSTARYGNAWSESYGYDRWGNRWVSANSGYSLLFVVPTAGDQFGANNRLVKQQNGTLLPGVPYDNAGNLISHPQMGTMTYDGENRLVGATSGTPLRTSSYEYDGEGKRVKRTVGGDTTLYVYDAFGMLAAAAGAGAAAATKYLTVDHLGSTRLVTDGAGGMAKCYDYMPFGEPLTIGRPSCFAADGYQQYPAGDKLTLRFTGQVRDEGTGLDYFGARYLSGGMGRFTSPDPFLPMIEFQPESADEDAVEEAREKFNQYIGQPQNWNRYAYAFNNPQRFIDPDGKAVPLVLYAAGTAIAGAVASPAGQRALIAGSQFLSRYGNRVGPVLAQSSQYISNAAYQLGPVLRGRVIETLRGAPEAFRSVRGIDNFDFVTRTATSIKSLDIFAKSYQNLNTLSSTLTGYVQSLAGYQGGNTPLGPVTNVARRVLEVVLPK